MTIARRALALLLAAPAVARADRSGSFVLDADVPVHVHRPAAWTPAGRVVVVLHGAARDAERYRDAWVPEAERHGFLLGCPEFSRDRFPGDAGYNLNPACFALVDAAAQALRAAAGSTRRDHALYGHSAGAQLVHRALLLTGLPNAGRVVAANAGWYTMPDPAMPWPYGLGGVEQAAPAAAFRKEVTILLGAEDRDPHHPALRRTAEADRQGITRFDRGHAFFAACRDAAATGRTPFHWRLGIVPGVAHSNAGMAPAAAAILAG